MASSYGNPSGAGNDFRRTSGSLLLCTGEAVRCCRWPHLNLHWKVAARLSARYEGKAP